MPNENQNQNRLDRMWKGVYRNVERMIEEMVERRVGGTIEGGKIGGDKVSGGGGSTPVPPDALPEGGYDDTYAPIEHEHDSQYYPRDEADSTFADITHDHDGVYAPVGHDHDADYAPLSHATRHEQGGADALEVVSLATIETNDELVLRPDGTGGVAWGEGPSGGGAGAAAYAETIGDGSQTSFIVTHDLDTSDVIVQLWELTGSEPVLATSDADSIEATAADTVTVTFTAAPASDSYRVVVLASGSTGNGGAGSAWEVIGYTITGTTGDVITFDGIAAGFVGFRLTVFYTGVNDTWFPVLRINNQSGSTHYSQQRLEAQGTGTSGNRQTRSEVPLGWDNFGSGVSGTATITIIQRNATDIARVIADVSNGGGSTLTRAIVGGIWHNSGGDKISRIDILPTLGGDFAAGSWGILEGFRP